ncbi:hypothetical protein J4G37_22105 [Microvirga sp. 3-52]|nr:hypothetical protein [Microvirga sp. 3-52]
MALEDITDPSAVRRAIKEFKKIGKASFLAKYGFGSARVEHRTVKRTYIRQL